jgi:hypothetical protein
MIKSQKIHTRENDDWHPAFAAQARRDGWRVLDIDAGHDIMFTNPKGLADLLN